MKKRYFVLLHTNHFAFKVKTNSFKIAKWFADLKCLKYAKIHDTDANDEGIPFSKCIYINEHKD